MSLTLIAAISNNNVIGNNDTLLWHLPVDMKHFRETTTGHTIIMGKKTFNSIGKVLPNRKNIVLTRDTAFTFPQIEVSHSSESLFSYYKNLEEEAFVIGGGEIYSQAMPYANKLIITHVIVSLKGDTYFPFIDETIWEKLTEEKRNADEENPFEVVFTIYTKKKETF